MNYRGQSSYFMENEAEILRLEIKTDPQAVREQAHWCGITAGMRVLDVGCGTGKTTSLLHEMVSPGGYILGIDFSAERIAYAKEHYGNKEGIDFLTLDLTKPLDGIGEFDIIWVRFVLEYYLKEAPEIVKNLKNSLKPGGYLCLIDLDYNCLNHYEPPPAIEELLPKLMSILAERYNFDAYAGRKLYAYLYDAGFEDIEMNLMAHHLIYGRAREEDAFNWLKKVELVAKKVEDLFVSYPGGGQGFVKDFKNFFFHPRRFTYTPLILGKGKKPKSINPEPRLFL